MTLEERTIQIAVRLARDNPHEPADTIAEWARYEAEELAEGSCPPADRDEPKDHAFNDCLDRHNPACPWAF